LTTCQPDYLSTFPSIQQLHEIIQLETIYRANLSDIDWSIMALMTVRAAAEKLGVGYSTMKRWIGDGRVRTTLTEGGHHRISDAEIDRLTSHNQPAGKARAARPPDPDETLAGLSARNRLAGFVEEVRIDGL